MKLKPSALLSSVAAGVFAMSAHADVEYTDQPQLHAIQQAVSAERIEHDIEKLVSFGTRHTLSETESDTRGIGAARRHVGNVTEYTLENVVIDNYFFGVASVSDDDFESPVVYPGAAGAFGE